MVRTVDDGRGGAGPFERFAARVGDLDSPFYEEERDRDVWNEASAVAFQLLLWATPAVAAVVVWVGGPAVLVTVAAMMVPWGAAVGMALVYAQRHDVDPANHRAFSIGRSWAWAAVMAALGSGVLRAAIELEPVSAVERFGRGFVQGAGVGIVVAGLLVALVAHWLGFRRDRGSAPDRGGPAAER